MNPRMKLFDVKWAINTAGPSPFDNERTEVFLLGCKKAKEGNPCPGCFNPKTWDDCIAEFDHDPVEMAVNIDKHAPNKYVTIGGGEPTDQIKGLIMLCRELKLRGFHIMVYTWRELREIFSDKSISDIIGGGFEFALDMVELLKHIDILVDGQYMAEERVYDENKDDGAYNSIGSGNQMVWDIKHGIEKLRSQDLWANSLVLEGIALRDVYALHIKPDTNDIVFLTNKDDVKFEQLVI